MLQRKVQTTGKGSYIVTLPISIVLALGIEKGDNVGITLSGKKIVLTPVPDAGQDSERTEVQTTPGYEGDVLQ